MIDSRILEMVFQNKAFQKGVDESIESLGQLDKSVNKLDGKNGSKALDTIGAAAETVSAKFSALQVMAYTALANITNRAVDAGISLAKSLSIDQVMSGWNKYGDKTTAMQTIMNNAHKENGESYDIDEVNAQMEKLNWFTDETSYNFTDMVSNIGKFTSMGQDLESSVTAMQGISVWASSAGQGVGEASRAMYNLAQAMGVGAVKLQDWKSIQNANMATEEFKNLVIEEATALGALTKSLDKEGKAVYKTLAGTEVSIKNFDQTLSEGWFNSDVLMDVLQEYGKFATKLSETVEDAGMEATELLGILNSKAYNEAANKTAYLTDYVEKNRIEFEKEGYTVEDLAASLELLNSEEYSLSKKAFQAAQEAKTFAEALDATKDAVSTGWMNIFEQIFGNYEEAKKVWTQLAEDLYGIFMPSVDAILDTLKAWRELEEFGNEEGTRDRLFESIHNLLALIFDIDEEVTSLASIMSDAWQEIFPSNAESNAFRLANAIEGFAVGVENLMQKIEDNKETIGSFFKAIFSSVKVVTTVLSTAWNALKQIVSGLLEGFGGNTADTIKSISDSIYEFNQGLINGGIQDFFDSLVSKVLKLKPVVNFVVDKISQLIEFIKIFTNYTVRAYNGGAKVGDMLANSAKAGDAFGRAIATIVGWISKLFKTFKKIFVFTKWATEAGKSLKDVNNYSSTTLRIAVALSGVINGVKKAFNKAKDGVKAFVNAIRGVKEEDAEEALKGPETALGAIASLASKASTKIFDFVASLKSAEESEGTMSKLAKFFKNLFKILKAVWSIVKTLFDALLEGFNTTFDNLSVDTIIKMIKEGLIITFLAKLVKGIKGFMGIGEGLTGVFDAITDTLGNFQKKTDVKIFKDIAIALLILAAAMVLIATLDYFELLKAMDAIATGLAGIYIVITQLSKNMKDNKAMKKVGKTMVAMAASILILAMAVRMLGKMDLKDLAKGVVAVTVLMAAMAGAMILMTKAGAVGMKGAKAMIAMAASILVLTASVYLLGKMDIDTLAKGLISVGVLLAEMSLFINSLRGAKKLVRIGVMMVAMAVSMVIFAAALRKIGDIDPDKVSNALITMGWVFAEVALFMQALRGTGSMMSTAAGMLIMAIAMNVIAGAVEKLGSMGTTEMIQGLIGIAGALATMVLAFVFVPDDALAGAAAMLVMAVAILALVPAIKAFGKMKVGAMVKSMIMLVGVVGIFVGSMMLLAPLGPVVLAVAGAFALFGAAILGIGAGIFLLATGITMLVGVGASAIVLVTSLLSVAIMAIPQFIAAVGLGIVELIKVLGASIEAIVTVVVTLISAVIQAIITLIPDIITLVTTILTSVLQLIIDVGPQLFEAAKTILVGLLDLLIEITPLVLEFIGGVVVGILDILIELTPKVIELIGGLLDGVFSLMEEYFPRTIDLLTNLIKEILAAIGDLIPNLLATIGKLLDAGIDFIAEYIPKLADLGLDLLVSLLAVIENHIEDVVETALKIIAGFIKGIADGLPDIIDAAFKLVISFINGLAEAIENNNESLFEAVDRLFWAVIDSIVNLLGFAWRKIKDAAGGLMDNGFIKGISDKINAVKTAIGDVITGIVDKIKATWDRMKEAGSNLIEGLKQGLLDNPVINTISDVADNVIGTFKKLFGIHSPSRVMAELGMYNMKGLAKGFEDNTDLVEDSAEYVGDETLDAFSSAMDKVFDLISSDEDFQPTITPVLDLSSIQNGGKALNGMFSDVSVRATASSYNSSAAAKSRSQYDVANAVNAALKSYSDKIVNAIAKSNSDTSINVTLEGDAAGLFNAVRTQNDRYKASTGKSALI